MDILGKIFGNNERVKLMRLFLIGDGLIFTKEEIHSKTKISEKRLLKEVNFLTKNGFLKKKKVKIKNDKNDKKYVTVVWCLNTNFRYVDEFKKLLTSTESLQKEDLLKKLSKVGKVKLVITAGVFMDNENSPADLLIVGDNLNKKSINSIIKSIETDIGRELRYGVLGTEDYKYRITVYDKFVRDILDFPHKKILNKMDE